ncbi:MAG: cyclic nucleotide-binding domain-containing protein [Polyangiales bacterium]
MSQAAGREPIATLDMLQDNRLFQGLQKSSLLTLQSELKSELAQPGEWIIREGDAADFMFVILTGELEVVSHGGSENADVRVALLGPGDWVGEMALLEPQPNRSASVRALAPSLLMRLTVDQVQRLQERDMGVYAALMRNIARELGRRLRVADRLIARTSAAMAKQYVLESRRPPPPSGKA